MKAYIVECLARANSEIAVPIHQSAPECVFELFRSPKGGERGGPFADMLRQGFADSGSVDKRSINIEAERD